MCENGNVKRAQNRANLEKTPHQNAFLIEACKKTPSGRGQTFEFNDGYTLSAVFSGAQGSELDVEMELKLILKASQTSKNHEKCALKKTWKINTATHGLLIDFDFKS